jgi:hypothetical protein
MRGSRGGGGYRDDYQPQMKHSMSYEPESGSSWQRGNDNEDNSYRKQSSYNNEGYRGGGGGRGFRGDRGGASNQYQ